MKQKRIGFFILLVGLFFIISVSGCVGKLSLERNNNLGAHNFSSIKNAQELGLITIGDVAARIEEVLKIEKDKKNHPKGLRPEDLRKAFGENLDYWGKSKTTEELIPHAGIKDSDLKKGVREAREKGEGYYSLVLDATIWERYGAGNWARNKTNFRKTYVKEGGNRFVLFIFREGDDKFLGAELREKGIYEVSDKTKRLGFIDSIFDAGYLLRRAVDSAD